MKECASKGHEKNLAFWLEINEDLPEYLYGDNVRLRQIILNLLSNAVKYTHEETVNLKLDGAINETSDYVQLNISVSDIGIRKNAEFKRQLSHRRDKFGTENAF